MRYNNYSQLKNSYKMVIRRRVTFVCLRSVQVQIQVKQDGLLRTGGWLLILMRLCPLLPLHLLQKFHGLHGHHRTASVRSESAPSSEDPSLGSVATPQSRAAALFPVLSCDLWCRRAGRRCADSGGSCAT